MIQIDFQALCSVLLGMLTLKTVPLTFLLGWKPVKPLRNIDFGWSFDPTLTNEIHVHFDDMSVYHHKITGVTGRNLQDAVRLSRFWSGASKIDEVVMPVEFETLSHLEIAVALVTAINP